MSDLIRDMDIPNLREHLDRWWQARVAQSAPGNLNDHQYLMSIINGMVQDTGELINITLGILDRMSEAAPQSNKLGSNL